MEMICESGQSRTCDLDCRYERFWMCLVDGKDMPKYKHYTLSKAKTEAVRLAGITGLDVFVLEAHSFCRTVPQPSIEWKDTIII